MTVLKKFKLKPVFQTIGYYLKGLYHRAGEHHIFLFSGGLSFSVFTCILPLILILFSVFGILLDIQGVREQINTFIDTLIPYQDPANFIKEIIFSRVQEFRIFKTLSGSLGIIGLFFAASGLFSSIRTILNTAYKVTETKWFYINKIRDMGMVLLVTVFFLLSMAVLPALDIIPPLLEKLELNQVAFVSFFFSTFLSVLMSLLSLLIIFFLFFLVYYLLPYGQQPFKVVTLSAIWAAFLWIIAKELFGLYITHAALLSRVYGTYVFMVILVLWIYYSSLVLVIGAEIGQLYKERKEEQNE